LLVVAVTGGFFSCSQDTIKAPIAITERSNADFKNLAIS
jgi:hypothetical protein